MPVASLLFRNILTLAASVKSQQATLRCLVGPSCLALKCHSTWQLRQHWPSQLHLHRLRHGRQSICTTVTAASGRASTVCQHMSSSQQGGRSLFCYGYKSASAYHCFYCTHGCMLRKSCATSYNFHVLWLQYVAAFKNVLHCCRLCNKAQAGLQMQGMWKGVWTVDRKMSWLWWLEYVSQLFSSSLWNRARLHHQHIPYCTGSYCSRILLLLENTSALLHSDGGLAIAHSPEVYVVHCKLLPAT